MVLLAVLQTAFLQQQAPAQLHERQQLHKYLTSAPNPKIGNETSKKSRKITK
jgi:hypothetical protein